MGWKSHIPDRAEHVRLALKSIVDEGWSLLEGDMVPAKALIKGCRTATDNDISKLSITKRNVLGDRISTLQGAV